MQEKHNIFRGHYYLCFQAHTVDLTAIFLKIKEDCYNYFLLTS